MNQAVFTYITSKSSNVAVFNINQEATDEFERKQRPNECHAAGKAAETVITCLISRKCLT